MEEGMVEEWVLQLLQLVQQIQAVVEAEELELLTNPAQQAVPD